LYARNVQSLLELMLDDQGQLIRDSEDEVLVRSCITREPEGDNR
jgi:NAD/NADP transhydrogenase alpha subunit